MAIPRLHSGYQHRLPPKLLNTNLRHACVSTGLPSVYMPGEVFRLSAGLTDCYAAAFYILLCYEFLSYTMYIALLFYEIFVNITSLFIFADSWKNIFAYEYLLRQLFPWLVVVCFWFFIADDCGAWKSWWKLEHVQDLLLGVCICFV